MDNVKGLADARSVPSAGGVIERRDHATNQLIPPLNVSRIRGAVLANGDSTTEDLAEKRQDAGIVEGRFWSY